ncbi:MAG: hypothetical protein SXA11_26055 [Cyanobacteriota bacterium]|nr:hypothetical protein [Cyanobacteriota bacterium]
MSGHPFELTASQLQEILDPEGRPIMPPGADAPPEVIAGGTFLVEDERGQLPPPPEMPTAEEIAEELGIELEELEEIAEELGIEPEEVSIVTTMAVGEEGGVEPDELPPDFPEPTGILAEQGGVVPDTLLPVTTEMTGEEGGDLPSIIEIEDPNLIEGEFPEPVTLALGEDGEAIVSPLDFPEPTGIVAEEGGFISEPLPLLTTEAVGEEGGGLTEVLSEQGEDPGFVTTMAIGEEGGIVTQAEGENGEIMELGEPLSEMTPPGNVDDFEIAEVADMPGAPGTQDGGNFDVTTLALGEEGGFNEVAYGELYPQLIDAVNSGVIPSLSDHYNNFGQFEAERIGIFSGTPGNDMVKPFGNNTIITGVPVFGYDAAIGDVVLGGNGSGEADILMGESSMTSTEEFILGSSQSQPFYVGSGDADFALIQNFDVGADEIHLSGFLEDYNFAIVNNSTNISTAAGDLVAIVENVSNIQDATLIFEG